MADLAATGPPTRNSGEQASTVLLEARGVDDQPFGLVAHAVDFGFEEVVVLLACSLGHLTVRCYAFRDGSGAVASWEFSEMASRTQEALRRWTWFVWVP